MLRKWVLKAIIQKGISFLPYKHRINFLFQKYITRGVQLTDGYLEDKLEHFKNHALFYEKHNGRIADIEVLELGTGWYPIIPVCFYLAGAKSVWTVDIADLLNEEGLKQALEKMLDYEAIGKLKQYYPRFQSERLRQLKLLVDARDFNFSKFEEVTGIKYWIGDARKLSLEDHSKDFIVSNNTFEHVYESVLMEILKEFDRVLKPGGIMSHFVDMSDHFAHLDSTITIYNFLRFTSRQWQWIDNSIQPQNRLRVDDYRQLYQSLGIPIIEEKNRPGDAEKLQNIKLAYPYDQKNTADLAVSHTYLVSKTSG